MIDDHTSACQNHLAPQSVVGYLKGVQVLGSTYTYIWVLLYVFESTAFLVYRVFASFPILKCKLVFTKYFHNMITKFYQKNKIMQYSSKNVCFMLFEFEKWSGMKPHVPTWDIS